MLKKIIRLAIIALILYGIYFVIALIATGTILLIAKIVLILIFLVLVLQAFGIDI